MTSNCLKTGPGNIHTNVMKIMKRMGLINWSTGRPISITLLLF